MLTATDLFRRCFGNEHWLVRPSIIEFAEKYHKEKLREEATSATVTYTQNYEEKRTLKNNQINGI